MSVAAPPAGARPTKRDEAWRYAPHRTLDALVFDVPSEPPSGEPSAIIATLPSLGGPRVVVVNGAVDRERSNLAAPQGVALSALADALGQGSPPVVPTSTAGPVDAFAVLHAEHATDGAVIDIAPGIHLDVPVHLVDLTVPGADGSTSCSEVVVRLGPGSSATLVESRVGAGERFGGSSVRTTVSLGEGATLDHIVVQDLAATQVHLGRVDVVQATDSTYCSRSFNLGADYGRLACHVELQGPGAVADLSGLYFGRGTQTLDQQVTVVHAVPDGTSRQTFRGVLDDASVGVFNGVIDVRPGADGTDAAQDNDNLVLSDRAEANTQPRLEILADEVSCTHGATVGQLDDNALYYLRSRGIPADDARRLLVNAFADQVVDGVAIADLRAWITERIGHDADA